LQNEINLPLIPLANSIEILDELSKKLGLKKSVLIDLAIKELAKKEANE